MAAIVLALLPTLSSAQEPQRLTLSDALALASQQSPGLVAERLRAEEARGVLVGARAWAPENPWVTATAAPWIEPVGGAAPWELEVEQRFEFPGVRAARVAAAREDVVTAEATAEDFERLLLVLVGSAYLEAVGAGERVRLRGEDQDLAEDLLRISILRVDRGADPPVTVGTARIRNAEAGRATLAAEADRQSALLRLTTLLGLSPDDLVVSTGQRNSSARHSDGFIQPSVCRGRLLSSRAMASRSSWLCTERSVRFGKYWRSSPLVFSLLPRCQGLCGSQK